MFTTQSRLLKRPCERSLLKTLCEKEKMLVTSTFSFSRNVFYPSQMKFQFFGHIFLSSANALNLDQSKKICRRVMGQEKKNTDYKLCLFSQYFLYLIAWDCLDTGMYGA